jgi:hypothetical protein
MKKLTYLTLFILFTSCATNRNITAWRCVNQYPVINGVGHDFVSLSGKFGRTDDLDSAICKVGDTLTLKKCRKFIMIAK